MKKKIKPKAGQESVWDYPRPPRLEKTDKHLIVEFDGKGKFRFIRGHSDKHTWFDL